MTASTEPLTSERLKEGAFYTTEEVAGLLRKTTTTLNRPHWIKRLAPIKSGGRYLYAGAKLLSYLESLGWEKPAPAKPLTPAQVRKKGQDALARSLAAV